MFVFIVWLGDVLDEAIRDVFHHTACPCTLQECLEHDSGYVIGVALVQKMEIDSDVHSQDEDVSGLALKSLFSSVCCSEVQLL